MNTLKKNKIYKECLFIVLLFSFFSTIPVFAEDQYLIDYYGIVSTEIDLNMSKMTSDLYYTQLCDINEFLVNDMRTESSLKNIPDMANLSYENLSFYTIIKKKENSSKWISTINIVNPKMNIKQSESKEYDSFYKILMEPKSVLQESIRNLLENKSSDNIAETFDSIEKTQNNSSITSTEFLSGTWTGEENIDKIVIMRGGRGFVIFTNGASMNITIELKNQNTENNIIIKQNGRANASYFPELSRTVALKEAINAEPIVWTFSLTNENTLTGSKRTLIEDNGNVSPADLNSVWKRKS